MAEQYFVQESDGRCQTRQSAARRMAATLVAVLLGALAGPAGAASTPSPAAKHIVPVFPASWDSFLQGFVRIINHSDTAGEVSIQAIDDTGYRPAPLTLPLAANQTQQFNSDDLENGNSGKGLSPGVGTTEAAYWRLHVSSDLDIEVLSYLRAADGFLTAMQDAVPTTGRRHRVAIFNPASNDKQVSWLRVANDGDADADVLIYGRDHDYEPGDSPIEIHVPAGEVAMLSAQHLENGTDDPAFFTGELGDGKGKWRLTVVATHEISVLSVLRSPSGHLSNLSGAADRHIAELARGEFDDSVSAPIVQGKCVNCHVRGGTADRGGAHLIFRSGSGEASYNFDQLVHFLEDHSPSDGAPPKDYVLDKVRGRRGHGGGVQLADGSALFRDMQRVLTVLDAEIADGIHVLQPD